LAEFTVSFLTAWGKGLARQGCRKIIEKTLCSELRTVSINGILLGQRLEGTHGFAPGLWVPSVYR
jgi:hypothetical protein